MVFLAVVVVCLLESNHVVAVFLWTVDRAVECHLKVLMFCYHFTWHRDILPTFSEHWGSFKVLQFEGYRQELLYAFPSVLWHCWLGDRKGIRPVKCWVLVCWWWWFDWSFARLIAPDVNTIFIILNAGPSGKMAVKMERETRNVVWGWQVVSMCLNMSYMPWAGHGSVC